MKKLLLIRHGKSDWNNPDLSDFERPLNERGIKNAPMMAQRLLDNNIVPQKIVSSPAFRAKQTAELFTKTLGIPNTEIQFSKEIYEATSTELLGLINMFDDQYKYIALVGHNPGITDLALHLCDSGLYNLPTCGMVMIHFPFTSWEMVSYETGSMTFFDFPKSDTEIDSILS
ncbi:SixA phosphatase family protein [Arcticibacter eurypsychrophilus]|uniref:SixA phosphatase family protein n=1 Tax=Arcticibacter eurypsychrophilus TaxID=1434752 RepID=UPI00084E040F|nr:histidine phosphatase family protein [Arcticibacter eurypsychrophilus]